MKGINVKKIAAFAGAAVLFGAGIAAADVVYGSTQLVDQNGQPTVKVYVGTNAAITDGVAAANIAAKIANEAYKSSTLTATLSGTPTCTVAGEEGTGACSIVEASKSVTLEVEVPGEVAGVHTFETLITDSVDRELGNRLASGPDDIWDDDETADDTVLTTNPTRALPSPTDPLYRIGNNEFTGFADYPIKDGVNSYTEIQSFWVGTGDRDVAYKDNKEAVVVDDYELMAYSVKFAGTDYGISVCTGGVPSNDSTAYAQCEEDSTYRTERHRVKIKFLGEEWIISSMTQASASLPSDNDVVDGGEVMLAKETSQGIINVGETLPAGAYSIQLSDIEVDSHDAIINVLDANGVVVGQYTIAEGDTEEITVDETTIKVHVYTTAPGFTLQAKWADIAIYSDEITLRDGAAYNGVTSESDDYDFKVSLLWKNRGWTSTATGANVNESDSLREIVIYTTDFDGPFEAGDAFNFLAVSPTFKLTYNGLDLEEEDYQKLELSTFEDEITVNSVAGGGACDGQFTYDIVKAIKVRTPGDQLLGGTGDLLSTSGLLEEIIFDAHVVNTNNQSIPNGTQSWAAGDTNMTQAVFWSTDGECYNWNIYNYTAISYPEQADGIRFSTAGDDSPYGSIFFDNGSSGFAVPSGFDGIVVLQEDAGKNNTTSSTWVYLAVPYNLTEDADEILFDTAASDADTGRYMGVFDSDYSDVEALFISERGSELTDVSDTSATIRVAKKIGHPTFSFAYATTELAEAVEEHKYSVGQSDTFGGVTFTVKAIDAQAGPCTVAGATCAVDTTGMSALIDGAASVEASQPFKLVTKLVALDSDATAGPAIVVGGPAVNTLAADLVTAGEVDFTATPVVVKEIGGKILVAGYTAEDTLTAADQFIAGVTRQ